MQEHLAAELVHGPDLRVVVLVEGHSDKAALEALAVRQGRDLTDEGVAVISMRGATNVGTFVSHFGPDGLDLRLAGLYDIAEMGAYRRALHRAGMGADLGRSDLERLGFHACVDDLEDELIRALGTEAVERVIEAEGELRSLRILQRQPAQRGWTVGAQLHRFMGSQGGRKLRYARLLVDALDLDRVPRPLDALLDHL